MEFNEILVSKGITKYRLSQLSQVPYSTVCDLCNRKTKVERINAETLYQLAHSLNLSTDELYEMLKQNSFDRTDFELYKSNTCHKLERLGTLEFIKDSLSNDYVTQYWKRNMYPEALYYLALTDFLSKKSEIPLWDKYNIYRSKKLKKPIFPLWIAQDKTISPEQAKEMLSDAIPEFVQYNIYEGEIENVF